jgi:hypothetical protein
MFIELELQKVEPQCAGVRTLECAPLRTLECAPPLHKHLESLINFFPISYDLLSLRKIHPRPAGSARQEAGDRTDGGGVFATVGEAGRSSVLTKIATVAGIVALRHERDAGWMGWVRQGGEGFSQKPDRQRPWQAALGRGTAGNRTGAALIQASCKTDAIAELYKLVYIASR